MPACLPFWCLFLLSLLPASAQLPLPVAGLHFSEGSGGSVMNQGTALGTATLSVSSGYPVFTSSVPAGLLAPPGNLHAIDFGSIAAGQGGRAVDLAPPGGGALGALSAFTLCGWLNCRDLTSGWGGNRVAFALNGPNGAGFDLVTIPDGSLRIGINEWPDAFGGGGPFSSAGRIPANASVPAANWVFTAVTYNSQLPTGQLSYYFGTAAQAAVLDSTHNYARGALSQTGPLTLGNFSPLISARNETGPSGGSRVFRGLLDEWRVYPAALTLAQVQAAQRLPAENGAAPTVRDTLPLPGRELRHLTQIEILFDRAVTGVHAADLTVNGQPAASVQAAGPDQYVFSFPEPPAGPVQVAWAPAHGITSAFGQPFAGGSWTYTRNPQAGMLAPVISEFMAKNRGTLRDGDGEASDWIEIHNPDEAPRPLAGYSLTDEPGWPGKWVFPEVTIPAHGYLVVFASEKNRAAAGAPLHTNFKLSGDGEFLGLADPQGNFISVFDPFPAQQDDISYGRDRSDPLVTGFFQGPTPGSANLASGQNQAPEVIFSHPGGRLNGSFTLNLTTANPAAQIRYEIAGAGATAGGNALPTTDSPLWTGPLVISGSCQVRARAFIPGSLPGPPRSETWLDYHSSAATPTSNLPQIVIHTLGTGDFSRTLFKDAFVSIHDSSPGRSSLGTAAATTSRAALRVRGNTSALSPKKSWSLELRDEHGDDAGKPLLGMASAADWVLSGPNEIDLSRIHNPFAYELARRAGQWAPRTRFVEVYLNTAGGAVTSAHYHGLYVLTEKMELDADRIDAGKLREHDTTEPAVSGGYLLQVDRLEAGEAGHTAPGIPKPVCFVEPSEPTLLLPQRDAQEQYIRSHLNACGNSLYGTGWNDPVNGYARYFDVPAAISNHLVKALCFSVDANNFSSYLVKPRGGKLILGPVWDFDRALESTDPRDDDTEVWSSQVPEVFDFFRYGWYERLFSDPWFWQQWVDRWQELRQGPYATASLLALVDSLADEVREAQSRDVARWPGVTTPRWSYQWEVDNLKSWLTRRADFIDRNFLPQPVFSRPAGNVSAGTQLTLSAIPGANIYFTLNGREPMTPSGQIFPGTQLYSGPITITGNTHVVARAWHPLHQNVHGGPGTGAPILSTRWSGPRRAVYVVNPVPLRITEIMFHPAGTPQDTTTADDDFEFIELQNTGSVAMSLTGVRLSGGISYEFTAASAITSLPPGARLVLVRNRTAFLLRYPHAASAIAGEYTGNLSNGGDRIILTGPLGEPVQDFLFADTWHPAADGTGASLVTADPAAPHTAAGWRPSTLTGGSPGAEDPLPFTFLHEPVSQPAVRGAPLTLSVEVAGATPPFSFEWKRNGGLVATTTGSGPAGFLEINAPSGTAADTWHVIVRDAAYPHGMPSAAAIITPVADTDGDGMSDEWEIAHGKNPGFAADGHADADGDGFSARIEYTAGTHPRIHHSRPRLEITRSSGQIRLEFTLAAARTASVQASTDGLTWHTVEEMAARPTADDCTVNIFSPAPRRFFRVVSPRMPPAP